MLKCKFVLSPIYPETDMWETIFGTLTLIFATLMSFIGLGGQVLKMQREKKCGLTIWIIALALAVYFCRSIYSILIGSYFILIPDFFGFVASVIMLIQYFKYRK